jgi:hypothetical protein
VGFRRGGLGCCGRGAVRVLAGAEEVVGGLDVPDLKTGEQEGGRGLAVRHCCWLITRAGSRGRWTYAARRRGKQREKATLWRVWVL